MKLRKCNIVGSILAGVIFCLVSVVHAKVPLWVKTEVMADGLVDDSKSIAIVEIKEMPLFSSTKKLHSGKLLDLPLSEWVDNEDVIEVYQIFESFAKVKGEFNSLIVFPQQLRGKPEDGYYFEPVKNTKWLMVFEEVEFETFTHHATPEGIVKEDCKKLLKRPIKGGVVEFLKDEDVDDDDQEFYKEFRGRFLSDAYVDELKLLRDEIAKVKKVEDLALLQKLKGNLKTDAGLSTLSHVILKMTSKLNEHQSADLEE